MLFKTTQKNFFILLSGLILLLCGLIVPTVFFLVWDLKVHQKVAAKKSMVLNHCGYRGEIVANKKNNEIRIFVLGGSTAYGYGVLDDETLPYYLQMMLNKEHGLFGVKFNVLNLAFNSESAICFKSTLKQFDYLNGDIVLSYSGYNDQSPDFSYYRFESDCFRNRSLVFKTTGYFPILFLKLRERYFLFRYGNVEEGYRRNQVLKQRVHEFCLVLAFKMKFLKKLEGRQLEDAAIDKYVKTIKKAADFSLERGKGFVYVRQPQIADNAFVEREDAAVKEALLASYGDSKKFLYIDLYDVFNERLAHGKLPPDLSFDGMHLTPIGNRIIAEKIMTAMSDYTDRFVRQRSHMLTRQRRLMAA